MNQIYQLYLDLLKKHGDPGPWPWFDQGDPASPTEIALGAILTQRTNWRNAALALENLHQVNLCSIAKIAQLAEIKELEELIRPSGFYKQKAKRVYDFCCFIMKEYGGLRNFIKEDLAIAREKLLVLPGIGPETADVILLYVGNKPTFVIDEYTKRLARKLKLAKKFTYDHLQNLFETNLPQDVKIYQNYHALIIWEEKPTSARTIPYRQKRLFDKT